MALTWTIDAEAPAKDVATVVNGVFAHGRSQAKDGDAEPISCLVRDKTLVVAGGSGRTEYHRLFVNHLWVAEELRGQGIGSRILLLLESEAARRGCRDALIETLDDSVARFYDRLGYKQIAFVASYVGHFNRHIMLKPSVTVPE